jgi:quinol-cytochrome oxidoreductase complex cytochrome b subunit
MDNVPKIIYIKKLHVNFFVEHTMTNPTKPQMKREPKAPCSITKFIFMLFLRGFWHFNYPYYSSSKYNPAYSLHLQKIIKDNKVTF